MTNIEAIKQDLKPYPIDEKLIVRQCEKNGIDASASVSDETTITRIVIEILAQMLELSQLSQGGISHSYDRKGLEKRIRRLCAEIGLDDSLFVGDVTVTYLGEL